MTPATTLVHRTGRAYVLAEGWMDKLQSVFALAIRLYVAHVFVASALTKLRDWNITVALFENEYHVPLLSPHLAAIMGAAGELGFSTLLVLGLGSRAAALGLFFVNAVAVISYPDLSPAGMKDHVLWGALLLVVAIYGPGRISADRAIGLH